MIFLGLYCTKKQLQLDYSKYFIKNTYSPQSFQIYFLKVNLSLTFRLVDHNTADGKNVLPVLQVMTVKDTNRPKSYREHWHAEGFHGHSPRPTPQISSRGRQWNGSLQSVTLDGRHICIFVGIKNPIPKEVPCIKVNHFHTASIYQEMWLWNHEKYRY